MNESKNISPDTDAYFGDYAVRPVPEEKHIGWGIQGLIWSGTVFCLPVFSLGGTMAAAMDAPSFLTAVFLGIVLVALIGFLTGAIGGRTHLTSGFNARFALGAAGGRIFSLILALALSGWFGYQCHDFAKSVVSTLTMFGFPSGSIFSASILAMLSSVTVLVIYNTVTHFRTISAP